jgi:hypothetical protein
MHFASASQNNEVLIYKRVKTCSVVKYYVLVPPCKVIKY